MRLVALVAASYLFISFAAALPFQDAGLKTDFERTSRRRLDKKDDGKPKIQPRRIEELTESLMMRARLMEKQLAELESLIPGYNAKAAARHFEPAGINKYGIARRPGVDFKDEFGTLTPKFKVLTGGLDKRPLKEEAEGLPVPTDRLLQLKLDAKLHSDADTLPPPSNLAASVSSSPAAAAAEVKPKLKTQTETKTETETETKLGYLSDPKNRGKIVAASAVSLVATLLVSNQIRTNVETQNQLDEASRKMQEQQAAAVRTGLADSSAMNTAATTNNASPLPLGQGVGLRQRSFRIQQKRSVIPHNHNHDHDHVTDLANSSRIEATSVSASGEENHVLNKRFNGRVLATGLIGTALLWTAYKAGKSLHDQHTLDSETRDRIAYYRSRPPAQQYNNFLPSWPYPVYGNFKWSDPPQPQTK
ncbi:hypothetical protein BCV70DRAFT_219598 [Testicularia cyperi]|uniref:Uncharacterized protein n=1 Tax=Testicularia cyperi TaxID=1882483 RepID=A0A317XFA7_9BASI|nr:hypothetical protein BCV70DRAFT_81968 [Testicularia cyperi]PWY97293.1 hypothetical protein BCV70DRAFT_219598 [Testicularia cyperi]